MAGILTRVAIATGAAIFALVLVAVALVFFGIALYLWMVSLPLSPAAAALIVGASAIILAGLGLLVARIAGGRRSTWARHGRQAAAEAAGEVGAQIAEGAAQLTQAYPYRTLLIALGVGFAAGLSPELRRLLTRGFRRPDR